MIRLIKRAWAALTPAVNYGRIIYTNDDPPRPIFLDQNGLAFSMIGSGLRDQNIVSNGGHDFAQRQVPGTLTTYSQVAARQYAADRWGITNENTSVQFRRVDTTGTQQTGLQARFYGEYSKLTSTGKIVVSQPIRARYCQHLRGRKVRLQLKLKASASKTIRLALLQLANAGTVDVVPGMAASAPSGTFVSAFGANSTDPTFGTNLAKIAPDSADNSSIANSALSCAVTTAWQRFGGTFTLPTDFKNLVVVVFTDSQFVAGDLFSMSEAGFYDGTEIRDWEPEGDANLEVQRSYCKTFELDTNPAASAGALTGEARIPSPVGASVAFPACWAWDFPVVMEQAPILVLFNPAAAGAQVRNQTLNTDCTASAVSADGSKRALIAATTPASTVAGTNILGVHITADAEF